jgi:hypothetical protein
MTKQLELEELKKHGARVAKNRKVRGVFRLEISTKVCHHTCVSL